MDTLGVVPQVDTGFSVRYAGVRLAGTWRGRLFADVSVELPLRIRTSEIQMAPDYRLRASILWRL